MPPGPFPSHSSLLGQIIIPYKNKIQYKYNNNPKQNSDNNINANIDTTRINIHNILVYRFHEVKNEIMNTKV